MLQSLHVKNLALINEAEVDLTSGLNIMTGETGAGKSIIIGSINIALGEKVPKEMMPRQCRLWAGRTDLFCRKRTGEKSVGRFRDRVRRRLSDHQQKDHKWQKYLKDQCRNRSGVQKSDRQQLF